MILNDLCDNYPLKFIDVSFLAQNVASFFFFPLFPEKERECACMPTGWGEEQRERGRERVNLKKPSCSVQNPV